MLEYTALEIEHDNFAEDEKIINVEKGKQLLYLLEEFALSKRMRQSDR